MNNQKSGGGFEGPILVLLVDNRTNHIKKLKSLLEEIGNYTILNAPDEAVACTLVENKHPDLVILNWESDGISGFNLISRIRSNKSNNGIPILIIAGEKTDSAEIYGGLQQGAMDYIREPIDPFEMAARLHASRILRDSNKKTDEKSAELEKLNETLFLLNESLEEKNRELYESVITDGLTRIYNRGFLMQSLSKEFSKSKRHGLTFSCIMVDIDHFKAVNDSYGHQAGDHALKQTAICIRQIIRLEDILGRYGGEEFLLILPNSDEKNSLSVAKKIQKAMEKLVVEYNGTKIDLRLSLGVADNKTGLPSSVDELILNADKALYSAKRNGRNQAVSYSSIIHQQPST